MNHQALSSFIWSVADLLRGDYKQSDYGKVILPFTDPIIVGQFMYHCHVLKHEDRGMMANIEVYDPNAGAASAEIHHH